MIIKNYSTLIKIPTFEERFNYLKEDLNSYVGQDTFGYSRYLNQSFYTSYEWRKFRRDIILRDNGCDLGIIDRPIIGKVFIHHINPIDQEDIVKRRQCLMDPENVICIAFDTHNALHYGSLDRVLQNVIDRKPNDTCPWKLR